MKSRPLIISSLLTIFTIQMAFSQALRIPQNVNFPSMAGRKVGVTSIEINWNAPRVNGREGKIWGTDIAYFGNQVLGYGSKVESPWRAGANECTTISVSTDVKINGKTLQAGKYALFMELHPDSTVLIFNKNIHEWGSYFYQKEMDVMRVTAFQQKNQPQLQERLTFNFSEQTPNSVIVSLDWEYWHIPFKIEVDAKKTILAEIKSQMSGELGFDPPSLIAAANWCETNDVNLEEALNWINSASSPTLGGVLNFRTLAIKSKITEKLGYKKEAENMMEEALSVGTVLELHQYGRELLNQQKLDAALGVFEQNYTKNKGVWPTNVGMMRVYSAKKDYKKALEFANAALLQAPDDTNKRFIEMAITNLSAGKGIE